MPTTPVTFEQSLDRGGDIFGNATSMESKRKAYDIRGLGNRYEWEDILGFAGHRLDNASAGLLELGFDRQAENTANRRRGEAFAQQVFAQNTGPTITDDDINTMFAQEADFAAGGFLENNNAIAESMGIRGVSGGVAADLAAQSQQQFLQNLAQAKGNIRIAKIQSDAQDAMRNLNFGFNLANFLAAPEDETDLAGITAYMEGIAGTAGMRAQAESIRDAAKNAKRGATMGLIGQLAGGGLSLAAGGIG